MAVDYYSYNPNEHKVEVEEEDEDDYIDMEVSSFAHFFSLSTNTALSSPQHAREFEFQMSSSVNVVKESTASPADELFYMGKLLPLHLPPRLQMVEKLLQDSTPKNFTEFYSTPLSTNTATTPITSNTPFESCNISPAESCQVSRELNPEEYFRVCGIDEEFQKSFIGDNSNAKKSWTKKLKTKIKSLFGKSDELSVSSSAEIRNKEEGLNLKSKNDHSEKEMKVSRKNSCRNIQQVVSQEIQSDSKDSKICHRRSFSGAFKRRSSTATKLLSSSSSPGSSSNSSSSSSSSSISSISTSNGSKDFPLLKRSSSAKSEIETSLIQGAIAHCKQSSSQQAIQSRKTLSEVGCHSFPSSRFAVLDDQTSICRG